MKLQEKTQSSQYNHQLSLVQHQCVCVCTVVPARAALLHDLGSVVTGQFAEAIVAVDDRPVHDLSVPQYEVGI